MQFPPLCRRINSFVLFWDQQLEGHPIKCNTYEEFLAKADLYVGEQTGSGVRDDTTPPGGISEDGSVSKRRFAEALDGDF